MGYICYNNEMQKLREVFNPTVVLSMAVLAVLGVFFIGHKNFGMDELDSMFITTSWSNVWQVNWLREGNMWLYYVLLYWWEGLGHSETVVRLLSVVFAAATLPVAYQLGKTLFNDRVARLATLMLAVNAFVIFNAQNARAYTLVLFLTTVAAYAFARYVLAGGARGSGRAWLALAAVANVLAVYSHLYAAFVVAAQFVSLAVVWRRTVWRDVVLAFGLTGAAVLPLFLAPSFHAQPIDWIPTPGLKTLAGTFVVLADDFVPLAVLYAAVLAAYGVRLWRGRAMWAGDRLAAWKLGFVAAWIAVPVMLALTVSLVAKPMYTSPYFFVCVVPFTLLVAAGLLAVVRRPRWRTMAYAVVAMLAAVRLYGWYSGSPVLAGALANTTENWGQTAQYLADNVAAGDAVLYYPSMERDKVDYYLREQGGDPLRDEIVLSPYFLTTGTLVTHLDETTLTNLPSRYGRVWFVVQRVEGKSAAEDTTQIEGFLKAHYRLVSMEKRGFLEVYQYSK
jgi:hypothetical protein